jgi:outer membrane protein assembly factor BamB
MPSLSASRRLTVFLLVFLLPIGVSAADWTTYRGDNARSGSTAETLTAPFAVRWQFDSPMNPETAWSSAEGRVIEGKLIGHRVKFDDAFHPAIVDGRVFFGSTVDDQLHCVDLRTGKHQWTFFTGGPVRLAPTVANGRVYFGSDDGHVYCIDAVSGELVWQLRAGPEEDWLLARGEMISRWPVRSSVLVEGGIAWFGAGIFPHEDVYLYAVDATNGSIIWKQDNLSAQDAGRNDISPQGYFLSSGDLLFVPSGRSLPTAFNSNTGKLVHRRTFSWRSTAGGVVGGTRALLADGQIYASGPHHLLAMEQKKGDVGFGWFAGRQMVVLGEDAYVATGKVVARLDRMAYAVNSRKRHQLEMEVYNLSRQIRNAGDKEAEIRQQLAAANEEILKIADIGVTWQMDTLDDAALLATGKLLFVGGEGRVTAYAADSGKVVWQAEVKGKARGLAAADGHLLVSTDAGSVYCFAAKNAVTTVPTPADVLKGDPYPADDLTAVYRQAAKNILKNTDIRRGFCLVVDGEEGRLAYELARQSQLEIYVVEADAKKVKTARHTLAKTDLYGSRVTVHQFDAADIPYSNYFANLIVSDRFVKEGELGVDVAKISRHLKPLGGILCLGQPDGNNVPATQTALKAAIGRGGLSAEEAVIESGNGLVTLKRGPLPGAGNWSHQYGNPGNTAISDERRVKGGLGVLWYGDPGPGDMVNRHDGAVGPLATAGRLYVQGESTIRAYDAYNGLFLWNYDNPGAIRTGVYKNVSPGNLAASDERLFHFVGKECFELDAATGETLRVHRLPESQDDGKHEWAYVAVEGDVLFGTATVLEDIDARARRRGRKTKDATDAIFAIDLNTGRHLWTFQGQSISHRTIAIGPKRVYFIDSTITSDQRTEILRQDKTALESLAGKEREIAEDRLKKADLRRAIAIDSQTGEQIWAQAVDVTDCSEIGIGGGMLTLMYRNGTLILCGANANGHYWKQFVAGDFSRRRLVALSADNGYKLWAKDANYRHRPVIIGDNVLAEPWMFDLKTGDQLTRANPITGEQVAWSMMRTGHHCGMLTGCESGMIVFRSGFTGFMDLEQDAGVRHFAGHRMGCWINAIPANGLVMIPEASVGCVCQFSIASTIVLEPREARRPWSIHSAVGANTPVKHLAINFGAPGDRKDSQGTVWLSYPRYKAYQETSLDIKFDFKLKFSNGGAYHSINEAGVNLSGVDTPWLYSSWAERLTRLTLPLLGEGDPPGKFTVRLYFADARSGEHATSTFDVKLNGKVAATAIELTGSADPLRAVVTEITDVEVTDNLTIEFVAKEGMPLLNAIEVLRNK